MAQSEDGTDGSDNLAKFIRNKSAARQQLLQGNLEESKIGQSQNMLIQGDLQLQLSHDEEL